MHTSYTDANELSQGAVIGISTGVGVFLVSVVFFILCAVVTCVLVKRNEAKPILVNMKKTTRDLKNLHSIESTNNTDSEMQNTAEPDSKENTASNGQNADPKEKLFQDKLKDLTDEIDNLAKILKVACDDDSDTPDPVTTENIKNLQQSMKKFLAVIDKKGDVA